jgi:hypothetical protein
MLSELTDGWVGTGEGKTRSQLLDAVPLGHDVGRAESSMNRDVRGGCPESGARIDGDHTSVVVG